MALNVLVVDHTAPLWQISKLALEVAAD